MANQQRILANAIGVGLIQRADTQVRPYNNCPLSANRYWFTPPAEGGMRFTFPPYGYYGYSGQIHPFDSGEFEDLLQHPAVGVRGSNPQEKVGGNLLFFQVLAQTEIDHLKGMSGDDVLDMAELAGQILGDDGHVLIPVLFQSLLE